MKTKINFKDSWNALLANAPLILIILYTLMPYKPWNLPISPSTVFIIVFFLFQFSELFRLWKFSVPKIEKILLAATVLTFTLSAFIKIDAFSAQGFIAYYSSFVTFLIIRLTYNPQRHAGILLKYFEYYLYLTCFLIFLEMFLGKKFFLSNLFTSIGFITETYRFGSGFSPYASLTGGLILWPLLNLIGTYIQKKPYLKIELTAIIAGFIALFYTLARAAWVGLTAGLLCFFILAMLYRYDLKKTFKTLTAVFIIFFTLSTFVPKNLYYHHAVGDRIEMTGSSFKKLYSYFSNSTDLETLEPTGTIDASSNTRVVLYTFALHKIYQSPLFGIGIDNFPLDYEKYAKTLNTDIKNNIDPAPRLEVHSFLLAYILENGIIASLAFFALIFYYISMAVKFRFSDQQVIILLVSFLSICTWMLFTGFLRERPFWIALGILSASIFHFFPKLELHLNTPVNE